MPRIGCACGVRMFTNVRLRNFKSYKDSGDIPLKPLTILIGANNSGKSTILQAILVLKQTLEDPSGAALVTSGPLVELGGYFDILHGKPSPNGDSSFGVSLTVEPTQKLLFTGQGKRPTIEIPMQSRLDVDFAFAAKANKIVVDKCSLGTKSKTLIDVHAGGRNWSSEEFPVGKSGWKPKLEFHNFIPNFDLGSSVAPQKMTKKLFRFLTSVHFQSLAWSHLLRNHLNRVGPHRLHVPWYSGIGTRVSSEFGSESANLLAALGSAQKVRETDRTLLQLVSEWACDKFRILKRIHLEAVDKAGIVHILLGDEYDGTQSINVAAMGEGVSQLLPIITSLVAEETGDCLLIEQPEIHLHPALQAKLAELFIDVATSGHRQVIVETHSEHILLRIRRKVAEGTLDPEKVAILYVEKSGMESKARTLDLNGRGHFSNWPDGFFDDAYHDAMALAEAASRKPR